MNAFRFSKVISDRLATFSAQAGNKSMQKAVFFGSGAAVATGALFASTLFADAPKSAVALDGESFVGFKLQKVTTLNHNTARFSFAFPAGTTDLGLPTASCLVVKFALPTNEGEKPKNVIRPYTPIHSETPGTFDLLVKKYPGGAASSHIHSLKVGDTLAMKGPIPKYILKQNEFKHIGMVAGGTGLTPMMQIISHVLADKSEKTKLSLIFANQTEEDILLKDWLDQQVKAHPGRFEVFYTLDKAPEGWKFGKGFVTEDMLKKFMPKPTEGKVFICGPDPFVKFLSGAKAPDRSQGPIGGLLEKMGFKSEDVFKF
ncbi:hypothetical protein SmJEL517_g06038 [Synchytrium microbalum]|uniref:NADH-cytochrome b5 reductase n=1 Tax=Synchytrium microbalum TaxID=1806994 RepID=A0A507BXD2_9FUNG|nr:uncharacterized protein SmJEL517_g06038 [Synchytrium microbalum]TPX30386.1 hypothetical protein SmJEL517_g06038 [Synchytrium microbalum]